MDELLDRLNNTPVNTSSGYPEIITIVTSAKMIKLVEETIKKEKYLRQNNFGKTFK